jgi:hypothetical protein
MVKVPIWEPSISDLPGANVKTPHATPEAFGSEIGTAQIQAGKAIESGLDKLGTALTGQEDEQEAIKSKVALSDHEVAVNNEMLRLQTTLPQEEAYKIPGMVNDFAQNDWSTRNQSISGKYRTIADTNAHLYWNKLYTKNQVDAVKGYSDAVDAQMKNEVARQGMSVFADPGTLPAVTGSIRAQVNELSLPLEIKRGILVNAAEHFQSQIIAGYKLRVENATNSGNIEEAKRLQLEAGKVVLSLPGTLTKALGIDALPKPIAPPVMMPGQPLPMPGSVRPGAQRMSMLSVEQDKPTIPQDNFNAAKTDLNLTPVEQDLYQRHLTNLYSANGVDNSNGSRSTLFITTQGVGDKTYLIPTVWDGRILTSDQALARAKNEGLDKFPSYANHDVAEARYQKMHEYMDNDTRTFQDYRAQLGRKAMIGATGGTFAGGGKYGPQYTPAAADNAQRPMRIGGDMTVEGTHYTFGSGGGGFASIPYGTYPVTPEIMGDWGRAHGAMGINYNRIYDPTLGRFREGIELHAGSGNMPMTQGCVAIAGNQYPQFKQQVLGMIARYGTVFLTVGPKGATITPTREGKITKASIDNQQFFALNNPKPLSNYDSRYQTVGVG